MSVFVLVEAPVQPDKVEDMKRYMAEILPDTRTFAGCQSVEVYFDDENPNQVVLAEIWGSREQHAQYAAWRTETGVMAKIGSMLAGPPAVRYFNRAPA